ncbi:SIR2 family protein [Reichenbachiella versicolor]|uniref:SIR2 family protein n=1 Tax=Reichenbachiella versicolor TaxID=1821036 RepID=UPI000D6E86BB|nr:SIR2 family protein [Reichenbachiella versicolor]
MDLNELYQEIQDRLRKQLALIIGTGSSISVDFDFGMGALESHLKSVIPMVVKGNKQAESEWKLVLENLDRKVDFENSLNVVKSDFLLESIIAETGKHVAKVSYKNISKISIGNIPIIALFERLKHALSYTNPIIDIITPNYDLIIENALSHCQIDYNDGFYGGIQKKFDWGESEQLFNRIENNSKTGKIYPKVYPHIRLHKVHGSLNYFVKNENVYRNDSLSYFESIDDYERFIITPGETKHKRIVENRHFYLEMDKAIDRARTYLFIGYGFNDIDIDKKICQNINQVSHRAVIVTKDLIGNAKTILDKNPEIIAISDNYNGGATIRYKGTELEHNKPIWQIDEFANEIL